jgi:tRNA U34 5-methylaminomethyl-2-thiouridine-forming methyltransferase MnmC
MISDPIRTDDGSFTLRHPVVGEAYHALDGAASETRNKYILPSRLSERRTQGPLHLLDVGFGLGMNCRAALDIPGNFPLHIDSIEHEPAALERGLQLFPNDPIILSLRTHGRYQAGLNSVKLHLGDIRQIIQTLSGPYDLIFHDPFSPLRNSECWTVDLFRAFHQRLHPGGALLTYSQSKIVRMGLHEAGFSLQDTPAPAGHRGGTLAQKQGDALPPEPTIPFRDPTLSASGHHIRSQREAELRNSTPSPRALKKTVSGVVQGAPEGFPAPPTDAKCDV